MLRPRHLAWLREPLKNHEFIHTTVPPSDNGRNYNERSLKFYICAAMVGARAVRRTYHSTLKIRQLVTTALSPISRNSQQAPIKATIGGYHQFSLPGQGQKMVYLFRSRLRWGGNPNFHSRVKAKKGHEKAKRKGIPLVLYLFLALTRR